MIPRVFQGLIKPDPGIPEIMRESVSKISLMILDFLQMAKQKFGDYGYNISNAAGASRVIRLVRMIEMMRQISRIELSLLITEMSEQLEEGSISKSIKSK